MSLDSLSATLIEKMVRDACAEIEASLQRGESGVTERLIADCAEIANDPDNVLELIYQEIVTREELGNRPEVDELVQRFPVWREQIERLMEVHDAVAAEERVVMEGVTETSRLLGKTLMGQSEPEGMSRSFAPRRVGQFELLEEIGRGGTGVVYRARHVNLDRLVALKLIQDIAGREQILRFQSEAEAAAHLQHPNIVQIYEVGEKDGYSYISLELVDGGSLADRMAQSPLEPDDAARLLVHIARAMEYAHAQGVVHRDLKPANILLTKNGEPKIADFGLAKRSWEHERARTRTGTILGTPGYMAPEQALGNNEAVGPAADVYALGTILYELLTGHAPFHASNLLETLEQVRFLEPVPPRRIRPRLSLDLETICLKCLRKQPESRYRSAGEFADDLQRYLSQEPIRARQVGALERWSKWVQRRPAIASLTAAVAIVAVLGLAGIFWQWNNSEQRRNELEKAIVEIKSARSQEVTQRERLKRTLYLQRIAAAYGEWLANHPGRAEQLLEQCEPELQSWEWRYLNRLIHAEHRTFGSHTLPACGLAYSPDGRKIASSCALWGYDTPGEIIIWDSVSGEKLHVLHGHDGPIAEVAFSPDGRQLASVGGRWFRPDQSEVIVWDVETGKTIRTLKSRAHLMDVDFSADRKWIAAAGTNGTVQVWHADTGEELQTLHGHSMDVYCVAFNPESTMLATGSRDSTVRLWNFQTGALLVSLQPGIDVRSLAFSPDGNRLAASTWSGIVKVWQVSPDKQGIDREIAHHQLRSERVRALQFSPDSQTLAVACSDGSLRIWHPITGAELHHFRAHTGNADNVAFHPEGHSLVTVGSDCQVKCWNLTANLEPVAIEPHNAQVSAVAFSPDGKSLAVAGGENHVHIGAGRKSLNIWDFKDNKITWKLDGHTGWLTSAAFSPTGKTVVSGSDDRTAIVWDVTTGKALYTLRGHEAAVNGVAYSHDGQYVATASADHTVKIWNAATGEEIATLSGHTGPVTAVSFGRQNDSLATASEDSTVRVWSAGQRRCVSILKGHSGKISDVQFSPQGNLIASCGDDAQLFVWECDTATSMADAWTSKYQLLSHDRRSIHRIDFHPDGDRLVGVREDSTMILWDMGTGQEALSQRTGPESMVAGDVAFAPDGEGLVVAYANRLIVRRAGAPSFQWLDDQRAPEWHLKAAQLCDSDRNWYGVRFHYDRLIAKEPKNWTYQFRRGDSLAWEGKWKLAAAAYSTAEELVKAETELNIDERLQMVKNYRASAHIHAFAGRYREALTILENVMKDLEETLTMSSDNRITREMANVALQRARLQHRYNSQEAKRAYTEAAMLYERSLKIEPEVIDDQLNLANTLLNYATYLPHAARGQVYDRARSILEPMGKKVPANHRAHYELALCLDDYGIWLEDTGKHDEAIQTLKEALKRRIDIVRNNPNDLSILRLLARSYDRLSAPTFNFVPDDEAKAFWRNFMLTMDMSLKSKPPHETSADDANAFAWYLATCPFVDLRDPEQAIYWAKIAVKKRPGDGGMLNTLAVAHFRSGEWETALRLFNQSMESRAGGDSYDWYFVAMGNWQIGNHDKAREWLAKSIQWAKEHYPTDSPLLRFQAEAKALITAETGS